MAACRADAIQILKAHWHAVEAIALALDARGTLTGDDIDLIIFEAEAEVERRAELSRRKRMAAMTARAAEFREATMKKPVRRTRRATRAPITPTGND